MDRGVIIEIGKHKQCMVLSTNAVMKIGKKFGGLEAMGESLLTNSITEKFELCCWLIALLCKQGYLIAKLAGDKKKYKLLTKTEIALLLTFSDIDRLEGAITECISKGTQQFIKSEDNGKSSSKNALNG